MPEIIPDHVPNPRTLLAWDGTAYRPVSIDAAARLQVRGEDQLFSYHSPLVSTRTGIISGANGSYDSVSPPAGEVWVITTVQAVDWTTATTSHRYRKNRGAVWAWFHEVVRAFAAQERSFFNGQLWLATGDVVQVHFPGSAAGDTCIVDLTGYVMTEE